MFPHVTVEPGASIPPSRLLLYSDLELEEPPLLAHTGLMIPYFQVRRGLPEASPVRATMVPCCAAQFAMCAVDCGAAQGYYRLSVSSFSASPYRNSLPRSRFFTSLLATLTFNGLSNPLSPLAKRLFNRRRAQGAKARRRHPQN